MSKSRYEKYPHAVKAFVDEDETDWAEEPVRPVRRSKPESRRDESTSKSRARPRLPRGKDAFDDNGF